MVRSKETALGFTLALLVLVAATASVWQETATTVVAVDSLQSIAASYPSAGEPPAQHRDLQEIFPMVYAALTIALVIFAGLLCAANCCWQALGPDDESVSSKIQKYQ